MISSFIDTILKKFNYDYIMQTLKTIIIAEAGVNHNGKVNLALKLIDKATEAGADYIKF